MNRFDIGLVGATACKMSHNLSSCNRSRARKRFVTFDDFVGWAAHYTVDPMLSASEINLFECHEEVLYLQPLIPPKRFNISPPIIGGCSEGLGVLCFL